MEVKKKSVETLIQLVLVAKAEGSVEKMWRRQAHISEAADNDRSPGEIK
jgi:hypothetical protein